MTDDAATVRDELWWHEDRKDCGMCQDPEALAALDRLAAQAARADRYEEALREILSPDVTFWSATRKIAREALDAETPDA